MKFYCVFNLQFPSSIIRERRCTSTTTTTITTTTTTMHCVQIANAAKRPPGREPNSNASSDHPQKDHQKDHGGGLWRKSAKKKKGGKKGKAKSMPSRVAATSGHGGGSVSFKGGKGDGGSMLIFGGGDVHHSVGGGLTAGHRRNSLSESDLLELPAGSEHHSTQQHADHSYMNAAVTNAVGAGASEGGRRRDGGIGGNGGGGGGGVGGAESPGSPPRHNRMGRRRSSWSMSDLTQFQEIMHDLNVGQWSSEDDDCTATPPATQADADGGGGGSAAKNTTTPVASPRPMPAPRPRWTTRRLTDYDCPHDGDAEHIPFPSGPATTPGSTANRATPANQSTTQRRRSTLSLSGDFPYTRPRSNSFHGVSEHMVGVLASEVEFDLSRSSVESVEAFRRASQDATLRARPRRSSSLPDLSTSATAVPELTGARGSTSFQAFLESVAHLDEGSTDDAEASAAERTQGSPNRGAGVEEFMLRRSFDHLAAKEHMHRRESSIDTAIFEAERTLVELQRARAVAAAAATNSGSNSMGGNGSRERSPALQLDHHQRQDTYATIPGDLLESRLRRQSSGNYATIIPPTSQLHRQGAVVDGTIGAAKATAATSAASAAGVLGGRRRRVSGATQRVPLHDSPLRSGSQTPVNTSPLCSPMLTPTSGRGSSGSATVFSFDRPANRSGALIDEKAEDYRRMMEEHSRAHQQPAYINTMQLKPQDLAGNPIYATIPGEASGNSSHLDSDC